MDDYEKILKDRFENDLALPEAAVEWLLGLWNFIQVFDDAADGDEIARNSLDRAIWDAMAGMPSNSFYQKHQAWLIPAVAQAFLKWAASDKAETAGEADEKTYMWRAGYYDVVCLVTGLVHGPSSEMAWRALSLYGETFGDYIKEFRDDA